MVAGSHYLRRENGPTLATTKFVLHPLDLRFADHQGIF
jgi:hypothetical protein